MLDYTRPINQVRLLIPDTERLEDPRDLQREPEYIFTDEQISGYLAVAGNSVKRAAAYALNAIAASEALTLKVLKTDDKQTDGAKLADALGKRANTLLEDARREDREEVGFDVVGYCVHPRDWAWH